MPHFNLLWAWSPWPPQAAHHSACFTLLSCKPLAVLAASPAAQQPDAAALAIKVSDIPARPRKLKMYLASSFVHTCWQPAGGCPACAASAIAPAPHRVEWDRPAHCCTTSGPDRHITLLLLAFIRPQYKAHQQMQLQLQLRICPPPAGSGNLLLCWPLHGACRFARGRAVPQWEVGGEVLHGKAAYWMFQGARLTTRPTCRRRSAVPRHTAPARSLSGWWLWLVCCCPA